MRARLSAKAGVRMEQMIISGEHPTGIYLAILDEKDEMKAAKVIGAMQDLGLGGGLLIANPVPEEHALSRKYMNEMIEEKELTPYLLNKIKELTGGKSLQANIELVK